MKRIFSVFAMQTGLLSHRLKKCGQKSTLILMYHRIVDPDREGKILEPGMYVTLRTFESHVVYIKNYFKVLSLKDYVLQNTEYIEKDDLPRVVITFDDGWHDFYKNAYPILKKYQIHATVFLPTNFIGSENWFWTDRLAYLISECGEAIFLHSMIRDIRNPLFRQLSRLKGSSHMILDKAIQILKSCSNEKIEKTISDLSTAWGIRASPPGRAFLSWEEVVELSQSGFVEFGSHTANHQILPALDDKTVRQELETSKSALISRKAADSDFIPFCYPNGNMDERIVRMVREVGYGAAVTTMPGWNLHKTDPFILKRVGIHQDMTFDTAMLKCRITGLI